MTNSEEQSLKEYIKQRMDGLDQRMDKLENEENDLKEYVKQRMDGFDQRMDGIEQEIAGVHKCIDKFDGRIEKLENKVEHGHNKLDNKVDKLDNKVENGYDKLNNRIDEVNNTLYSRMTYWGGGIIATFILAVLAHWMV